MKYRTHLIDDRREYEAVIAKMAELINLDSARKGLPGRVVKHLFRTTGFFEFNHILTPRFLSILRGFSQRSGDNEVFLMSLDPDADQYFYKNFQRYGALKIYPLEPEEAYFNALVDAPLSSPADSLQINTNIVALFGNSGEWAVWGERELDVGLAVSNLPLDEWPTLEEFKWITESAAIIKVIARNYRNHQIPNEFLQSFENNYFLKTF